MEDLLKIKKFVEERRRISDWLDNMEVENYSINSDLTVDVDGDVHLDDNLLTELPVQFGKVDGFFSVDDNLLSSMKGFPKEINYSLYIANNRLTEIEYLPKGTSVVECEGNLEILYRPEGYTGSFWNTEQMRDENGYWYSAELKRDGTYGQRSD